uniref:DNA polymerase epsilon catalytic subunit n=1 Tax=Globodera rostochiensis TaxID=31243 RepID=A0A914I899_GLORO
MAEETPKNAPVQRAETFGKEQRLEAIRQRNYIDAKFGYQPYTESTARNAWLINVQQSEVFDDQTKCILASVELYFLEEDGSRFKICYPFRPYLYLETNQGQEYVVAAYLSRKYHFLQVEHTEKENLDLKNHLAGLRSRFLRVSFPSNAENRLAAQQASDYTELLTEYMGGGKAHFDDGPLEQIVDIREYDLPFDMRVCIDQQFFVGLWYTVFGRDPVTKTPSIRRNEALVDPPEPVICAFDIETTKAPLKFPDASVDKIMMISYMINESGFLIVNREIVAADIEDFEFTPRPEFRGEFRVFNEPNECALLTRFFDHLLRVRPHIMATYNGDFFDWPFVEARAAAVLPRATSSMSAQLGFCRDAQDEYKHPNCVHMDVYRWVQRDSYLPMGSQSLKAATREKLRYEPVELDPEKMVPMARNQPNVLASYSVSDAVSTYYLYIKYVHPFIFALCTIIPLGPDDVLRKGSGTLCEALLMVQAQRSNIIFPNKQAAKEQRLTDDGHLILSDTYVGGHVEAVESGVFRADIPCRFKLDVEALTQLMEDVRPTMEQELRNEAIVEDISEALIERPLRTEGPRIYHLDVGAMYPNIILTNRLQPPAVVTEVECMACIHNAPDAKCKRPLQWVWRGEIVPASRGEYEMMMLQLEKERFGKERKPFNALAQEEREKISKERIKEYCRNAYKRLHDTSEIQRTTTICQRENPFYVDTVRAFRDRRYEYKQMLKNAKGALEAVPSDDLGARKQAQQRVVLYDSLQLAHKCILNSFYGYVMRKGSRWFSMEMAGIVCYTGANIIRETRELVERIGRPLELDTDGIWCLLPASFPEHFVFHTKAGKPLKLFYPGAMLNALVKDRFTNDQYHSVDKATGECTISSENSIFFEVDGPYYAMILPASKEEGKKLKKRYAVFNFDRSLAELKGFEVFKRFLEGSTLQDIYESVAKEANYWLNILADKGQTLSRRELFDLIGESKNMSKQLEEYGEQKSTSISTAKRLAEFLGTDIVRNKGLACNFVVSRFPLGDPVSERTLPLAIFDAAPKERIKFLRKWTKVVALGEEFASDKCLKELIDWQYYIERLGSSIQKIITIPAALQGISNPVPRVAHPQWLENKRRERIELHTQPRITDMFKIASSLTTVRTPGTGRKGRGSVQLTPWSLKKKMKSLEDGTAAAAQSPQAAMTPLRRKRPLATIVDDQQQGDAATASDSSKRICVDGEDGVVELLEDEDVENRPQVSSGLIALDTLLLEDDGLRAHNSNHDQPNQTDLETGQKTAKVVKKKGTAQLKREAKRAAVQQHAARAFPRRCFDTMNRPKKRCWNNDGFLLWLDYLKTKWRLQRQARVAAFNEALLEHAMDGDESATTTAAASTADLFDDRTSAVQLSRAAAALTLARRESTWHILQIAESRVSGKYTLFALVDGALRKVGLNVPRTIYVDDIEPRHTLVGRLAQKILPRQRPCAYLYEFNIDEQLFSARMTDLNTEMCLWRINGVYETRAPLLFNALVHTGVRCHVERAAVQGTTADLPIDAITRIERSSDPATAAGAARANANSTFNLLDPVLCHLRLLFLYEHRHHSSGRSVLGLFIPSVGQAHFFVVNRASIDLRNLDTLYAMELQKFLRQRAELAESDFPGMREQCQRVQSVQPQQCTTEKEAARRLHALLNALKWSPTEPALLCTQTNRTQAQLFKDFPALREFASVCLRVPEPDGLLNVLDWANAMARRSMQHFFNSFTYLKEYWSMSAYTEIPVGNLPADLPSLALDIAFARALRAKNHLLWTSPSAMPDFGGKELEDWRLGNEWESAAFTEARPFVLNKETFEANFVTAELSLGAVAVTALLQSANISEAEGTSEQTGFAATASAQPTTMSIGEALSHRLLAGLAKYHDDTVAVGPTLRCLREVFHRLVKDIHHYGNVFADQLVVNMHRWISDPSSLLFHPSLRATLITLMRKLCLLLVAEMQKLGATVIHCSFTRVVFSTNRDSLPTARAFVDSLLASLAKRPMFGSLQLQLKHFSDMLLWIDHANYALVFASDDERDGRVEQHFALAERIPRARGCHTFFSTAIAGFLGMLSQKQRQHNHQRRGNTTNDEEENLPSQSVESTTTFDLAAYSVTQLREELVPGLFKLATRLVAARPQLRRLTEHCGDGGEDVPLEFVNCICLVLGVIPALDEHVEQIRNQLLLILQQDGSSKEMYGPLADWKPCSGVLLDNVFCPKCAESNDLDVVAHPTSAEDGSDESVQHHQQQQQRENGANATPSSSFACPHCGAAYPLSLVEELLLERAARMHAAFTLQDWRCTACKKMGSKFLARYCDCNNRFEGVLGAERLGQNFSLLRRVCRRHGMVNVEQWLDQIEQCYE